MQTDATTSKVVSITVLHLIKTVEYALLILIFYTNTRVCHTDLKR
ncbi:hypothetical protein SDC9_164926 [bioreactor metagenome]|uniref:Uncharacterized protein n=1 Tax=bioreactor metagenome TaxID=1076179 RepID=A0A645FSZ6_9ZZZZ